MLVRAWVCARLRVGAGPVGHDVVCRWNLRGECGNEVQSIIVVSCECGGVCERPRCKARRGVVPNFGGSMQMKVLIKILRPTVLDETIANSAI